MIEYRWGMAFLYAFVFILGLVIGSFINVLIYRIPMGKSVVTPASSCTGCGKRLAAFELIPVFSFVFLKGRCRHCGAPISFRYPLVELLTAVIYVVLFSKFGFSVPFVSYAFLMLILIAVFFIDTDHRIIPDELVIAGIIGGAPLFVYNIFSPLPEVFGDDRWWTPAAGFFSGSGLLLLVALLGSVLYRTEDAMGMGDVKLMAPIGLFLGWKLCLTGLFISVLLAGVSSMMLILLGKKDRKDTIPFGPFIVAGTFFTIMWGWGILSRMYG